jgi:two-component system OmpR family sensor kinase
VSDSTNFRSPEKGVRLFYQIALRVVAVAAILGVLEVVIVVAMYVDDLETLSEDLVSVESRRIANLVAQYGVSANVPTLLRESSTRAVAIFDSSGNRLLVDNPGRLPLPDPPVADVQSSTSREAHGKQFVLTGIRRIDIDGRPLWIALAISGEGLRPFIPALYKEVCDHALLPLIPLSMLLLLFNVVVVRRMLKPLERAVVEVDALDPSDPSRRLHQPVSPVEVSSLLRAINRALDRLERATQTLRRFTADAAHELRTPLAAMTLTIERLPASVERQELVQDAVGALREKVFERFWRADRQHGGAGLGLAITRSIMEACGDRVEISDARNGGAIVGLVFPELAS